MLQVVVVWENRRAAFQGEGRLLCHRVGNRMCDYYMHGNQSKMRRGAKKSLIPSPLKSGPVSTAMGEEKRKTKEELMRTQKASEQNTEGLYCSVVL